MDQQIGNELLAFFKALADANRLKIIGLLAQRTYSVNEISDLLQLSPSTVSHHLGRLAELGLVSARAEGYYSIYQLETKNLEDMSRRLLTRESFASITVEENMDDFDRKVVRDFSLPDGRLKSIPAQQKKVMSILRYLIKEFEFDRDYPEKEVNEILARFHEDTAYLRRAMIDHRLMTRQNGIYRRVMPVEA